MKQFSETIRSANIARRGTVLVLMMVFGLIGSATAAPGDVAPEDMGAQGVCDILDQSGTPCVAAHSTTRALYAAYAGPLYQVQRSDGKTRDIATVGAGGAADAASQDAFCGTATCTITRIYDQSPRHNDLTIEGPGGNGGQDRGSVANALPVQVRGRRVYGLLIEPGMGYRNNTTHGVATGSQPESVMMVTSALHTNAGCCFDYGNAEISSRDTGNGHMDAVNFSRICNSYRKCLGSGPWVQADLENGLFMSARGGNADSPYRGNPAPFVTALLKNDGKTFFALKSGNAQRGPLGLIYRGHEPLWKPGYSPMHLEGGIVLGTGGDDTNASSGCFFEGVMTAGTSSAAADNAVQANIVAAGYGG